MRNRKALPRAPPFPGDGPTFVTPTREAAVSVTRFSPTAVAQGVIAGMPRERAHVILYQLQHHPAHDFWIDGRYTPAEAAPRATLSIFDLADDPQGRLTDPVDTLMFHLPQAALDEMTEDLGSAPVNSLRAPDGWNTRDPLLDRMHGLIIDALVADDAGNRLLQDHLMLGISAHFAHAYGGMRRSQTRRRGGLAPWQERRAKELIAANLARDLSLSQIATECGLSHAHFARAFKISVGVTPHGFLQIRRVEEAKALMAAPDLALADVALACGFADQSHFTRVFRQMIGIGPGAWRQLRRE